MLVDHNYGGTDALIYRRASGQGIDNASIRCYLREDYEAGRRSLVYVLAQVGTDVAGRWDRPMMLDPEAYALVYYKQGEYGPDVHYLTVE